MESLFKLALNVGQSVWYAHYAVWGPATGRLLRQHSYGACLVHCLCRRQIVIPDLNLCFHWLTFQWGACKIDIDFVPETVAFTVWDGNKFTSDWLHAVSDQLVKGKENFGMRRRISFLSCFVWLWEISQRKFVAHSIVCSLVNWASLWLVLYCLHSLLNFHVLINFLQPEPNKCIWPSIMCSHALIYM